MRYNFSWSASIKVILMCAALLALVLAAVLAIRPALADIAPPQMPPGSNPEAETIDTKVRMMEEKVVIEVLEETNPDEMGTAWVWAEFQMKNMGDVPERMMVRFPSSFDDGISGYPEIENMLVSINNVVVDTARVNRVGVPDNWNDPVQWIEFEVLFPVGEMVEIEVEYGLTGTGEYPFVSYGYLLETGVGWYDTIGSAEIIVRLPYAASSLNVFVDSSPWGRTTAGANLSGNEVSWYFEDFEPAYENNISIAMVWPSAWNKIKEEQQTVWDNPQDGDAWGRLGKMYKEVGRLRRGTRTDQGGDCLFNMSVEAYQKALELLPGDALWHAAYADLLVWDSVYGYTRSAEARAQFIEALREMYIAYTLDPEEPYVLDYLESYVFPREAVDLEGGEYIFYWLTQTPTLIPEEAAPTQTQVLPTLVPIVTATPEPTPVPPTQPPVPTLEEETPQEDSGGIKLPFCGSAILFPLALGIVAGFPFLIRKRN